MTRVGPVILSVVGDTFTERCRILAITWVGTLANGDVAQLRGRGDSAADVLWKGAYPDIVGLNVGPTGIHAPDGFTLATLSAGEVHVYLKEQ